MIKSDDSITERQDLVNVDPLSRDLINEMEAATREVVAFTGLKDRHQDHSGKDGACRDPTGLTVPG